MTINLPIRNKISFSNLIEKKDSSVIDELFLMLQDFNLDNRYQAMRTLKDISINFQDEIQVKVKELLINLKSQDYDSKIKATLAFGCLNENINKEVIDNLIDNLKDSNKILQKNIIASLGKLGKTSPYVVASLLKKYETADRFTRKKMLQIFGAIGIKAGKAVPVIADELSGSDINLKIQAIITLGKLKAESRTVVPLLKKIYKEGDNAIKMYTGITLSSIATPDALNFLEISETNA